MIHFKLALILNALQIWLGQIIEAIGGTLKHP